MSTLPEDTAFNHDGEAEGPVMAIKMGVVNALRSVFTESFFSDDQEKSDSVVSVDMEYPTAISQYPAIWVQFSLSKLTPSGMAHMTAEHNEDGSLKSVIRQWMYEGRVNLLVAALTSMQRDRISDRLISVLSFAARDEIPGIDGDTSFLDTLQSYPYASIMVNTDRIIPAGQNITVGTADEGDRLVYEDSYSIEILGEYQQVREAGGVVRLSRVDVIPEHMNNSIKPGTWV